MKMTRKTRKIVVFLSVGLMLLFIQSIIYQIILNEVGEQNALFGLPFNLSSFLFGCFLLIFVIIMYLIFPKTKQKLDKTTTL